MYWLYMTIALLMSSTSCTQNITCVHTQGEATDVVDTDQSPTNDIKPDVNLEIPGV